MTTASPAVYCCCGGHVDGCCCSGGGGGCRSCGAICPNPWRTLERPLRKKAGTATAAAAGRAVGIPPRDNAEVVDAAAAAAVAVVFAGVGPAPPPRAGPVQ